MIAHGAVPPERASWNRLRRVRAMTRGRLFLMSVTCAAALGLAAAGVLDIRPRIVWNGSESAPEGVYIIRREGLHLGGYVLVKPPAEFQLLMAERGYLPPGVPLVKRVAAGAGDEICRENARISINNILVARALERDSLDRPMPQWRGCFVLGADEVFLLNDHEKSLDGRYFGATKRADIIGAATLFWERRRRPDPHE